MDLILCHQTADFDAVGAAVGLTRLKAGGKIVLTGGAHPTVREFLALHRNALAIVERRSVDPQKIRSLIIPDTQKRSRLGKAAEWFDLPNLKTIEVYDHHMGAEMDIPATYSVIEPVGAATTLIVEQLQKHGIDLTSAEATVMALGIHVDTGSLTFDQTTPRDALALAWLMAQGANLSLIAEYSHPSLSPQLQQLLTQSLNNLRKVTIRDCTLSWILLKTDTFIPGLASLASEILKLTEVDTLLLAHEYGTKKPEEKKITIIGRSRLPETDFNQLFQPLGGGGHGQAASVTLRLNKDKPFKLAELVEKLQKQIPYPLTARDLMSSPVRTIRPETTIEQAQSILLRYGHSGLCVVNTSDKLVGIISRRDIDLALHHGFHHAPVKGYMSSNLKTVTPATIISEIESLMVTYDVGRLPVLKDEQLIGIVTRTDILRQRRGGNQLEKEETSNASPIAFLLPPNAQSLISQQILQFLDLASTEAEKRGWNLYLVGGAVRDLLLRQQNEANPDNISPLQDIDLVVDGFHEAANANAGVELAKALQIEFPNCRLEVHGAFQTAALLWHHDSQFGNLWVDIATARTEFYPYPAANPVVEASSIRQDLYRRDFTINALALKLTNSQTGELLDFFGGILDLESHQIRVLHPNSFIEDPTRIYRAVRFAVRLGFTIESQTESYIRYAIASGVYERSQAENHSPPALTTRLKTELKYILQAPYWKRALQVLQSLEALRCLHPDLKLDKQLWWQIRLLDRWLRKFDPDNSLNHWLMRLELILAKLPGETGSKVATNLQLPLNTVQRLQNLASVERKIVNELRQSLLPSQVVKLLRQYKLPTLALLAVKTPRQIRKLIWQYLIHWRNVQSPLNGNDLKALGYQPGPQYRQILDDLLTAKLDSKISDRAEAKNYLRSNYS